MSFDFKKIGINTEERYECIYTTISRDGVKNAAAIGLKYMGENIVGARIFENSNTLKNIFETKRYVVNITQDPLVFTNATIDRLSDDYYTDDEDIAVLKDAGSYMIVDVLDIAELGNKDTPIQNDEKSFLIKGEVKELVINDPNIKAFNRGLGGLIECLVNYSRYKIVDDEKRQAYMDRVIENERIINRIGNDEIKKSIRLVKEEYENS